MGAVKPDNPAPSWRVRGQPLREEGFREVEFNAPPPGLVVTETDEAFAARVERLRQWARGQLAADVSPREPVAPAGLDPSPW